MTIDPQLLEILACPCERHAPVEVVPGAAVEATAPEATTALLCTHCRTTFPVRDGIPVMLLDEATPGPCGIGNAAAADEG